MLHQLTFELEQLMQAGHHWRIPKCGSANTRQLTYSPLTHTVCRIEVRIKALDTLDGILEVHGGIFSDQAWAVIFRGVLFPMIDSAKTDESISTSSRYPTENPMFESRGDSWIGTYYCSMFLPSFSSL